MQGNYRTNPRASGALGRLLRCWRLATFLVFIVVGSLSAQVQFQVQVRGADELNSDSTRRWGLELPNDQDAVAWLKRASDAANEGDWKLAADTLERIIEQHGERTVSLDGTHYYSASHLAQMQLAAWPAEGLAVYRLLHDGETNRLLAKARSEYDLDALRLIARKFPMTTRGPEAMNLLATWLLDRREAREALDVLSRLEHLPHNSAGTWEMLLKRAIAHTLSDQREQAGLALSRLRSLSRENMRDVPDDWRRQVESIQRFYEHTKLEGRIGDTVFVSHWEQRLGPSQHGGRMAGIDPIAADDDEWTSILPGAERLPVKKALEISRKRGRPPVWQAVSDGSRLFVTCPSGLIARDLATFDLLWQAFPKVRMRNPRVEEHRMIVNLGGVILEETNDNSPRMDLESTRALFHEYRGDVSTAMGLVFTIEQEHPAEEQFPTFEGVLPPNSHLGDEVLAESNTLRAYEADTGRAAWFRGRGGPVSDELRNAHFCAAPVAHGSRLLVPYRVNGDLMLAVLERDGALVRTVLLGTGRASLFPMHGVLTPTIHDGTLYLQTGAGLLIALNVHDYSLRWVTRYTPAERARNMRSRGGPWWMDERFGVPQPDQWLSSPPIVAGGVLILAPHDADQLFGIDIETGVEKWSTPRGGHKYLVGADDRQVLVAGRKVTSISLADGKTRWATSRIEPTGRPLICGDVVLVPTQGGLLRYSLETGEAAGDLMATSEPLGNLFATDGALYSVGLASITKYPDPKQTRHLALARLERNPNDVDALLRLAWMETLADNWDAAHERLDRAESLIASANLPGNGAIGTTGYFDQNEYRLRISHQRVAALLRGAASADDELRGALLERAESAALRSSDRIEAGLAYCEFLDDIDRSAEGFSRALRLLVDVGTETLRMGPDFRVRADVLIAEFLERAWTSMSEEERTESGEEIERVASAYGARMRLSDALGFIDLGRRLDLQLAASAMESDENETGVFFLERALLRSSQPAARLEPLLSLAVAYRFPGEELPADIGAARRVLNELAADFAEEMLPTHVGERVGLASDAKVKDFVEAMRSTFPEHLNAGGRVLPRVLEEASMLGLLREVIAAPASQSAVRDGASFITAGTPHDLHAEVLPIHLGGEVRGLDLTAEKDDLDWWISGQKSPLEDALPPVDRRDATTYDAASFGRVMILSTPAQICAVGMASGRTMWAPLAVDTSAGPLPQPSVLCAEGIVVAAADAQTLVATHARNDATPIWRRSWGRATLRLMRVVDDRVIVIDRDATKVFVLDLRSGRLRAEYGLVAESEGLIDDRIDFQNPDAHVSLVDRVVLRSHGNRVIGRDAMSGRPVWPAIELDGLVTALYELSDGHAGVAYGANKFRLIRAATGESVSEWTAVGLAMPPLDVVLDFPSSRGALGGGRMLMFTRTDESPPEYVLESFPLSQADLPWQRKLGPLATVSRQMMRASPEFIAAIRNSLPPMAERRRSRRGEQLDFDGQLPPRLEIVDKTTGERFAVRPYEFSEGRLGDESAPQTSALNVSRRIMDVIVLNDRVIGVAPEGFFILADAAMLPQRDERQP